VTTPRSRASLGGRSERAWRVVYNRIPSRPTFLRKARPRFSLLDVASTRHFSSRPRAPCGVTRRASITDAAETSNGIVSAKFYATPFPPDIRRDDAISSVAKIIFPEIIVPRARCSVARVTNFSEEVSSRRIYLSRSRVRKMDVGSKELKITIRHACRCSE